ncbi:hypothetical protein GGR51DRAFT_570791 [Nemania sp. FL0031]|nr:hypothetical protein GGR51DRAFT_570791 [Nemania sp. FL0031]
MANVLPSFQSKMRRATSGQGPGENRGRPNEYAPLINEHLRYDPNQGRWIVLQWRRMNHWADTHSSNPIVEWLAQFLDFVKTTLLCTPISPLLLLAPLSALGNILEWPPGVVLGLIATSILPMIAILDFLTEELSQTMGERGGGLFNIFAGSVGGVAVRATLLGHGKVRLAQTSILGQLLFTLLFTSGACFLSSGLVDLRHASGRIQIFAGPALGHTPLHLITPSLVILAPSILLPLLETKGSVAYEYNVQFMSCIAAIVLIIFCCFWILFELRTHINIYYAETDMNDEVSQMGEQERPPLPRPLAGLSALFVTFVIILYSGFMADVIQRAEDIHGINSLFFGLVFVPIITSGAQGLAAVIVAWRAKIDMSVRTIFASSVQFLLVSTPGLVLLGFPLQGQPMTLYFTTAEVVSGALSIALIAYILQRGEANYLDGAMLVGLYIIIVSNFVLSSVSVTPADP